MVTVQPVPYMVVPRTLGIPKSFSDTSAMKSSNSVFAHVARVWGDADKWRTIEFGTQGTLQYRMIFVDKLKDLEMSPLHGIPLYGGAGQLSFICTTSKGEWANYEIADDERLNPIRIHSSPAGRPTHFKDNSPWNIGFLPQTWGDDELACEDFGFLPYNSGPIEVIELGSRNAKTGDVYSVKPLAAFAVIEKAAKLSWKVLAIDVEDKKAAELADLVDIQRTNPTLLDEIKEWLRAAHCTGPDFSPHAFGLNARPQGCPTAVRVIAECHGCWQLMQDSHADELRDVGKPKSARAYEAAWRQHTAVRVAECIPLSHRVTAGRQVPAGPPKKLPSVAGRIREAAAAAGASGVSRVSTLTGKGGSASSPATPLQTSPPRESSGVLMSKPEASGSSSRSPSEGREGKEEVGVGEEKEGVSSRKRSLQRQRSLPAKEVATPGVAPEVDLGDLYASLPRLPSPRNTNPNPTVNTGRVRLLKNATVSSKPLADEGPASRQLAGGAVPQERQLVRSRSTGLLELWGEKEGEEGEHVGWKSPGSFRGFDLPPSNETSTNDVSAIVMALPVEDDEEEVEELEEARAREKVGSSRRGRAKSGMELEEAGGSGMFRRTQSFGAQGLRGKWEEEENGEEDEDGELYQQQRIQAPVVSRLRRAGRVVVGGGGGGGGGGEGGGRRVVDVDPGLGGSQDWQRQRRFHSAVGGRSPFLQAQNVRPILKRREGQKHSEQKQNLHQAPGGSSDTLWEEALKQFSQTLGKPVQLQLTEEEKRSLEWESSSQDSGWGSVGERMTGRSADYWGGGGGRRGGKKERM